MLQAFNLRLLTLSLDFGGTIVVIALALILLTLLLVGIYILISYKKCPSDKILVIYGDIRDKDGKCDHSRCIHGGGAFVKPIIQAYEYLDLTPMTFDVNVKNSLTKNNIGIDISTNFTVSISIEKDVMLNAAERLLGINPAKIQEYAKDIIFGQLNITIASIDFEKSCSYRDAFMEALALNIETEIKKIGLRLVTCRLINVELH